MPTSGEGPRSGMPGRFAVSQYAGRANAGITPSGRLDRLLPARQELVRVELLRRDDALQAERRGHDVTGRGHDLGTHVPEALGGRLGTHEALHDEKLGLGGFRLDLAV